MRKEKSAKETEFKEHLNIKYGREGSKTRDRFEEEMESFKLGLVIREARIFRNLTQEELAVKSGTTKFYISRIENNASDIRLSTLMKIIYDGLGGKLKFALDF
ncbi:MAG: helix-turn-helix transcriptional regulator [Ignavibacteria bacterium]